MASWNELRTDMQIIVNKAIKKTGELADSASVAVEIKMTEAKLSAAFEKLGRLTYKQLKASESQAEKISETISLIDSLKEDLKSLRQNAEKIKKQWHSEGEKEEILTPDTETEEQEK